MLDSIYMQVLDMSKTASIVILVVILARLLLKKVPKVFSYVLWAVVLFRLLCPVTFEAPVSIVPEMTSVSQGYTLSEESISVLGAGEAAYQAVGDALNGGLGIQHIRTTEKTETGMTKYVTTDWWSVWILFGQYVWVAGIAAMLICSAVSYLKLRKKLSVVVPLRDNIFIADDMKSPFVVGLFRPRIYLPCNLEAKEQEYIILHEQHHIKRFDHIMKALAFFALTIHWFNPLVWVAFFLAGKDMEMSCDEAVIRKIGGDVRADYSASLLTLATGRRIIAGTPLAFGEGDTKRRIRNLANWKKPAFWVVLTAGVACIVFSVTLLTNPAAKREFPINGTNVSELNTEQVVEMIAKAEKLEDGSQLCVNADNFDLMFTSDFEWANDGAIRFFYIRNQKTYSAQLRMFHDENKYFITDTSEWIEQDQIFKLFSYLDALKYMPQEEIRRLSPNADAYSVFLRHDGVPGDYERMLKYSQYGIEESDGWQIHLEVQPLHVVESGGYNGRGDEVIHLFYGRVDLPMVEDEALVCIAESDGMNAYVEPGYYMDGFDYEYSRLPRGEMLSSGNLIFTANWDSEELVISEDYYEKISSDSTFIHRETYTVFRNDEGKFVLPVTYKNPGTNEMAVYFIHGENGTYVMKIQFGIDPISTSTEPQILQVTEQQLLYAFASSIEHGEIVTDCVIADDKAYGLDGVVQYADETGKPWKLAFIRDGGVYPVSMDWDMEYAIVSELVYLGNGVVQVFVENMNTGTLHSCTMAYSYDEDKIQTNFVAASEEYVPPTSNVEESLVPYLLRILRADTQIFDGPGYDFVFVGSLGAAGTYTIVEEHVDEEGNRWGKLKSGIGWIDLAVARSDYTAPVSVLFGNNDLLSGMEYYEYRGDDSEYAVDLLFLANEVLTDVRFSTIQYETGKPAIGEELDLVAELNPEKPYLARVVFYGDTTTYGISFIDAGGFERNYQIYISGRNGALMMEEY